MSERSRKSTAKKWTLIVLIIFVLIAVIGGTYSRYTSTGTGTGTAHIAKWAISMGGTDITPSGNTAFTIGFTESESTYVADGKIAPGSTLYADFVIDPTGSEVAIDYSFTLGALDPAVTDLGISAVKVSNGTTFNTESNTTLTASAGVYSGTIALPTDPESGDKIAMTSAQAVTVRVELAWTDDTDNNAAHTASGVAAVTNDVVTMTVTGTATQKVS